MLTEPCVDRSKGVASLAPTLLLGLLLSSSGHADEGAPPSEPAPPAGISLADAVKEALVSNLDLESQRRSLAADREEIGLARSVLLPQIDTGIQGQVLDADRSDSSRGNNKQESAQFQAGLRQLVYDENSWAAFEIQKHVYSGQVQQFESFRLSVVEETAGSFLGLDLAQRLLDIQRQNRELTRENRKTSRARIAAGWSSEREILRWDVQLAGNDGSVRAQEALVLSGRLELNRARNLPPETEVQATPATLDGYGFVYSRDAIAEAVLAPEQDRRMRDFLTRMGLVRSPELAELDEAIAAADRQLVARRRAFWVPTVSVGAGVDYLINDSGRSEFNQTEWGVKGVLSFPLLEGGAKFSGLDQAREILSSLRTQRSATALTLEQTIRAALVRASAAFETIGFAQRASQAARKNYELVEASYTLGVSSILDLLDAQAQLLDAEVALANSVNGFLEELVGAERAISFYPFLQPAAEVDATLDQLTRELGLSP